MPNFTWQPPATQDDESLATPKGSQGHHWLVLVICDIITHCQVHQGGMTQPLLCFDDYLIWYVTSLILYVKGLLLPQSRNFAFTCYFIHVFSLCHYTILETFQLEGDSNQWDNHDSWACSLHSSSQTNSPCLLARALQPPPITKGSHLLIGTSMTHS